MSLFIHDGLLGHVPNPGFQWSYPNSLQTIDSDGLRWNGEPPPPDTHPPILTVGDSYTYGDEVNDSETWPACLQRLTGRRVLNGGVTGYGFDQTVLRAEQLADRYAPSAIIVSFIEDNVRRAEMRALWWQDKPWFAIEGGQLVYQAAAPPPWAKLPRRFHSWLGRHLHELPPHRRSRAQYIENRIAAALPPPLQHLIGYYTRVHPVGFGVEIARRLIERLAELQRRRGIRVVVMAQHPPASWGDRRLAIRIRRVTQDVLDHATACGLATLDTYHRLAAEPSPRRFYATYHMNARGNLMVANLLAATLPALLAYPGPPAQIATSACRR